MYAYGLTDLQKSDIIIVENGKSFSCNVIILIGIFGKYVDMDGNIVEGFIYIFFGAQFIWNTTKLCENVVCAKMNQQIMYHKMYECSFQSFFLCP